jgi:MFS family permease
MIGSIISNTGTWMQRIAQDWLVLTHLTQHSGTSVGIVMSLQFGPPIILLPLTGITADRFNRRHMLFLTQGALALTSAFLGGLVLFEHIQLWHVYALAGLSGCIAAFDSPVRQTFVAELVGDQDLPNAVALNSSVFSTASLVGPALAGSLIAFTGTGWLFVINAITFMAVLGSLLLMHPGELRPFSSPDAKENNFAKLWLDCWHEVRGKPDILIAFAMLFLVSTYGLNFPIFISTMALNVFHGDAHLYGMLTSAMAVGSVLGGLFSAQREHPKIKTLGMSALAFGVCCSVAALMPNAYWLGVTLVLLGLVTQIYTTSSNSLVQLGATKTMRGRIMALYMAILMGCTPLGAPLMGWVADTWSARWALGVAASSGLMAAAIAWAYRLSRQRALNTPSSPLKEQQ